MNSRAGADRAERGWRVGHQGRDAMYYEELHDGAWQRLDLNAEMQMGRAHHVIYFASPVDWLRYPAWARHRRTEIVARIMSEFREPDYEYQGVASSAPAVQPPVATREPDLPVTTAAKSASSAVPLPVAQLAAFPALLRELIEAELEAGNTLVEIESTFPAPPAGAYAMLQNPVSTRPRMTAGGVRFYERNSSQYFGEFTDADKFYFVIEAPRVPPPEPDMDAIREELAAKERAANAVIDK